MKISKVSNFKNQLGEGVWWDDDNMLLHWTDILEGKLYSFNLKTQKETYKKFNGKLQIIYNKNNIIHFCIFILLTPSNL